MTAPIDTRRWLFSFVPVGLGAVILAAEATNGDLAEGSSGSLSWPSSVRSWRSAGASRQSAVRAATGRMSGTR
jgi:hypothetical protein